MIDEFFKNFPIGLKLYQAFESIKPEILRALDRVEIIGKNIYGEYTREFDEEIHEIFTKTVKKILPQASIISEEGKETTDSHYLIFLDPIDGSLNVARKIPVYAFSFALAEKKPDINLLLGLIWIIPEDSVYIGLKGVGILKISNGIVEKIEPKSTQDADILIEVANTDGVAVNEIRKFAAIRTLGSIAYSGIKLIERQIDGIIDNSYKLKFTDIAPLIIMFEESNIYFSFRAKGTLIENPRAALVASHKREIYQRLSKFLR